MVNLTLENWDLESIDTVFFGDMDADDFFENREFLPEPVFEPNSINLWNEFQEEFRDDWSSSLFSASRILVYSSVVLSGLLLLNCMYSDKILF